MTHDPPPPLPPPNSTTTAPPPLPLTYVATRATDTLGAPLDEFEGAELVANAPKWRVLLYPDRLRLLPPDGSLPYDVHRPEVGQKVELLDAMLAPRMMTAKLDKRVPLRLTRPGFTAVENWIGKDRLLRQTMKARLAWLLPLAVFLLAPTLLFPLFDAGGDRPLKLDPTSLALGGGFLVLWACWRMRPRAWLFLLDAALFLTLACLIAWRLRDGWSWLSFAFMLLQLMLFLSGIRLFRRFRGVTPAPADA